MLKGTYIFYENGKEVSRHSNIITKFGKRFLTNFIAGNIGISQKDMAFGIESGTQISTISGNGSLVTITTLSDHNLSVGNKISIYGVNPNSYNFSNVSVNTIVSPTIFTVSSAANASYVSGGSIVSDVDTKLGFEFYRVPVTLGSTNIQTSGGITSYSVVYKTTIPQDVVGQIYEIGLYPSGRLSINNFDSKFITDFDDSLDWSDSSGVNPLSTAAYYRIGGNLLTMSTAANSSKEYKATIPSIDLSGYSNEDTIRIAYYKSDVNLSSIKVRLYSDPSRYYEATITPSSGTGYKFSNDIPLSTFFAGATSPAPDSTNINQVGIIVTASSAGSTSVGMDALRINDEDTFSPDFGLISKSILTTPLSKLAGRQVDVEYRLELNF